MSDPHSRKRVFVTHPSLPPLEEFMEFLREPWESGVLTHNGPLVQRLEREMAAFLGVQNIVALTNGTLALQLALRALGIQGGEIITTPFSWVATCSALKWERCVPVFVDINEETFNIDLEKIEAAITPKTRALMPVHVFGNPCDIEGIAAIAQKHGIKVIYDAAHAFGVRYGGRSLLDFGDISATSLHATKLFNTGEGGACVCTDPELHERLKRLRFFGHDESREIVEDGCNAKMTEVHAALGLANLQYLDDVLTRRREIHETYRSHLKHCEFLSWQKIDEKSYNFSYMPVVFDSEQRLLATQTALNAIGIFPKRYFYPSLNTMEAVRPYVSMPVSEGLARRILCLPSYHALDSENVERTAAIVAGD